VPTIGHGFRRTLVGLKFVEEYAEPNENLSVSDAPLWG